MSRGKVVCNFEAMDQARAHHHHAICMEKPRCNMPDDMPLIGRTRWPPGVPTQDAIERQQVSIHDGHDHVDHNASGLGMRCRGRRIRPVPGLAHCTIVPLGLGADVGSAIRGFRLHACRLVHQTKLADVHGNLPHVVANPVTHHEPQSVGKDAQKV